MKKIIALLLIFTFAALLKPQPASALFFLICGDSDVTSFLFDGSNLVISMQPPDFTSDKEIKNYQLHYVEGPGVDESLPNINTSSSFVFITPIDEINPAVYINGEINNVTFELVHTDGPACDFDIDISQEMAAQMLAASTLGNPACTVTDSGPDKDKTGQCTTQQVCSKKWLKGQNCQQSSKGGSDVGCCFDPNPNPAGSTTSLTPITPINPSCGIGGKPGTKTALGCIPTEPEDFIKIFFPWAIGIAGLSAFLLIAYGAILNLTAAGNPEQVQKAREIISSAITGLVLIIFSVVLLQIIFGDILGLDTLN